MFTQLATPDSLKRQVAIPNAENHVLGSPIKSKDVESVKNEAEKFAIEILKLHHTTIKSIFNINFSFIQSPAKKSINYYANKNDQNTFLLY